MLQSRILAPRKKNQLNVAVNNAVRRIFGFRRWQSIRQLRDFYGFDSMEKLFEKARLRFFHSIKDHSNQVIKFLSGLLCETEEHERNRTW